MKSPLRYFTLLLLVFLLNPVVAQEKSDTLPEDYKRNVIKWNLTPFLLWGSENINLSYERVLEAHRSFSVNAGYFVLPAIIGSYDSINISSTRKRSGFSVSGDYRFYFKNRNTRRAPDGLFWGPYGSFHHYSFENYFEVVNSSIGHGSLSLDGGISIIGIGVELGYQFVIKERFTIDLIFMGPSVSIYTGKLKIDGDISADGENEYLDAIRDILTSKYPFLDELLNNKEFSTKGAATNFGYGMRYLIQIGYRF